MSDKDGLRKENRKDKGYSAGWKARKSNQKKAPRAVMHMGTV